MLLLLVVVALYYSDFEKDRVVEWDGRNKSHNGVLTLLAFDYDELSVSIFSAYSLSLTQIISVSIISISPVNTEHVTNPKQHKLITKYNNNKQNKQNLPQLEAGLP